MKRTLLLAIVIIPVLFAGYAAFHPGVAFTATPLAEMPAGDLPQSGNFTVDAVHTCVGFDIGHFGISRVQGRFPKLVGSLHADAKDVSKSSVKVTIETASVDTAVAPRDADLRSPNFLDAEKYPQMTFTSTSIVKQGNSYKAVGDLTLHGVTKPVIIRFKAYGPIKDPWGNTRIGMVSEPLVIDRSDFEMTHDADTISDDVNIRLSLEAILDK